MQTKNRLAKAGHLNTGLHCNIHYRGTCGCHSGCRNKKLWGGGNSVEDKMQELCIISAKLKCGLLKIRKNKDLLCNTFLKDMYFMFSTADPGFGSLTCPQQSTL